MDKKLVRKGVIQAGRQDIRREAQELARYIPARLAPLAQVVYNYCWSWHPDGEQVFRDIDEYEWTLSGRNPVRFLWRASQPALERAAADKRLVARVDALRDFLEEELDREPSQDGIPPENPVAFFCAEFGLHRSMPVYSGGLGVLAGDILKEASDRALPMVGIGLMYQRGFFHQRIDASGYQHEYWYATGPDRRPTAKITVEEGEPLCVTVPIWGESVRVHVWRVEVGRIPLFLLDTEVQENTPRQRYITARLYEGNHQIRLAQYALLGVGGIRVLNALGIRPSVIHMNEGHPAAATLEMVRREVDAGVPFPEACDRVRRRVVFTTHTPVPAGNETYPPDEFGAVFQDMAQAMGTDREGLLRLCRVRPDDRNEPPGMTVLAIRMSRSVNGVSRIHGGVARRMWRDLFPGRSGEDVPITHVTNGAHLPTWIAPEIRRLLDRYLRPDWYLQERVMDPATWEAVDSIPDEELWAARKAMSTRLISWAKTHSVIDRLTRGDTMEYALAASQTLDPNALTLGFARRLATYKRLYLLTHDPGRVLPMLEGPRPIQLLFAGKAHPRDEEAKHMLQRMFQLKGNRSVGQRVVFIEDYDMGVARRMVAGCDVWINLPRPPLEASGTSGMKAAFNGTLNLSVLDGWWAEAYDGRNGWGIDGTEDPDHGAKDARDAAAFYDLMEKEVIPLFYDRDEKGVPHGWVQRMKASIRTIAPRFCATRMVDEYVRRIYRGGSV
jgi:starch phosphorylase